MPGECRIYFSTSTTLQLVVRTDTGSRTGVLAGRVASLDAVESVGLVGLRCPAERRARSGGTHNGFRFLSLHGHWVMLTGVAAKWLEAARKRPPSKKTTLPPILAVHRGGSKRTEVALGSANAVTLLHTQSQALASGRHGVSPNLNELYSTVFIIFR